MLISDPRDQAEFGSAVRGLLGDPERANRIGAAAQARVRENFLAPHHLGRYFELIEQLTSARERSDPGEPGAVGTPASRLGATPP